MKKWHVLWTPQVSAPTHTARTAITSRICAKTIQLSYLRTGNLSPNPEKSKKSRLQRILIPVLCLFLTSCMLITIILVVPKPFFGLIPTRFKILFQKCKNQRSSGSKRIRAFWTIDWKRFASAQETFPSSNSRDQKWSDSRKSNTNPGKGYKCFFGYSICSGTNQRPSIQETSCHPCLGRSSWSKFFWIAMHSVHPCQDPYTLDQQQERFWRLSLPEHLVTWKWIW